MHQGQINLSGELTTTRPLLLAHPLTLTHTRALLLRDFSYA